jgi:hypothetical protein
MRAVLVPLLLLLAACDSPAPRFMGAERFEVTRDGRTYVLYRRGTEVEVIRTGYARRREHRAIHLTMIDVIGVVTGCRPIPSTIRGDSGEIRARIACP